VLQSLTLKHFKSLASSGCRRLLHSFPPKLDSISLHCQLWLVAQIDQLKGAAVIRLRSTRLEVDVWNESTWMFTRHLCTKTPTPFLPSCSLLFWLSRDSPFGAFRSSRRALITRLTHTSTHTWPALFVPPRRRRHRRSLRPVYRHLSLPVLLRCASCLPIFEHLPPTHLDTGASPLPRVLTPSAFGQTS
jgi:hypothetical protein